MRVRRWWRWTALALGLGIPVTARAAGYGLYEAGAAVMGMAGAGTASVDDPSALYYNAAALTRIVREDEADERGSWYLGGSVLTPFTSFAGVNPYPGFGVTEEMDANMFVIPALFYARPIGEQWAAGAGLYSPYGLGVDWKDPDTFTGRYIVTEAQLQTANLGFTAAYQVTPTVSLAAVGNILFSKVELQNRLLQPIPGGGGAQTDVASAELESDWEPGYGWGAAISVKPSDQWRAGATYRGKIITKPSGDADFEQILTGNPTFDAAVAASLPPDQGVSTVLRFPAIWAAGVAWTPANWTLETSVVFTEWSLFSDLPLEFEQTPSANRTIIEDYDDALAIRLGAEHRLASWSYRFGYYYEQEAAPAESVSPLLPDTRRHGIALGAGFEPWNGVTVDLYNLGIITEQRSTEGVNRDGYDGEYKTYVNAFGLNVGFRW
ncbi:MAG TPA: outer membrane protein transport protein [Candidatus Eisenbacteria bacterium]|nr:outer membrane protein transport protein [Candidatus Eisenbacteria bacterium]